MEQNRVPLPNGQNRVRWAPVLIAGGLLIALIALLLPRVKPSKRAEDASATPTATMSTAGHSSTPNPNASRLHSASGGAANESAEEIVARRTAQFARSRREIALARGRKQNIPMPPDVEKFFDAAEAGNWPEVERLFTLLLAQRRQQPPPPELEPFWSPIHVTFGTLESAHDWPAQQYLDYGNAILDSLKPGMVYVGGTDPGRFIPELMAETDNAEPHMVITQNALADGTYLEYLRDLYGDRLGLPSKDDVRHIYENYATDLQKRIAHDRQFPDAPREVLPGEDLQPAEGAAWSVKVGDGNFKISGQVAVMALNERILQSILEKNPSLAFGLEESFPLKSTYASATTLGPIMELRAPDGADARALTTDAASQSIAYWQTTAQQLMSDTTAMNSDDVKKTYSKMISGQANLFVSHNLSDQAEQAYRIALQICPYNPESAIGLVQLLMNQHRSQDALGVAQSASRADPKNGALTSLVESLQKSTVR